MSIIALSTPALAAEGGDIDELVVATSIPRNQRDAAVTAARALADPPGSAYLAIQAADCADWIALAAFPALPLC